jgi:hypothetical protein
LLLLMKFSQRSRCEYGQAYSMIRKKPAPGLDPGVDADFPKKIILH